MGVMSEIYINDIFEELSEENKRLLNELMFANKCLNSLNKFKTFIDSVFDKLNTNLDSNERIRYEDINKEIEESLKHKTNEINVKICDNENETKYSDSIDFNERNGKKLPKKSNNRKNVENISNESNVNSNQIFICDFIGCGKQFTKRESFLYHKSIHKTKYICDFEGCVYRTHHSGAFKRHTNKHKGINPYKCEICGKGYPSQSGIRTHIPSAHGKKYEQPLVCGIDNCMKALKSEHQFNSHKYLYHSEKKYFCDYPNCGLKYPRKQCLERHKILHSNEIPFVCNIEGCLKGYKSKSSRDKHIKTHFITERKFKCLVIGCDKDFLDKISLNTHTKNCHSGIKYPCIWPGCEFETNSPSSLNVHKTIHSTESFECDWPHCGKRFKNKIKLKIHIRIHKSDKRYACLWPGCQYRCTDSGNFVKHRKIHEKH